MSKKGLLTLVVGAATLAAAGYASSSSAVVAIAVRDTGTIAVDGSQVTTVTAGGTRTLPDRPPARSLYRPGTRNPPTVLE